MLPQLPGLLTRSIPAMVRPRKTSSETRRSRFGRATGDVATPSGGGGASGGWIVVAMLAASTERTTRGMRRTLRISLPWWYLTSTRKGICRAAYMGQYGTARAVRRLGKGQRQPLKSGGVRMRHTITRDGIVAGVLGATAVAVWFLGVDTLHGHPLSTPAGLGEGLLRLFGPPGNEGMLAHVVAYTIFHYFAFILAGLLVSVVVHWAHTSPTVLAGALIL